MAAAKHAHGAMRCFSFAIAVAASAHRPGSNCSDAILGSLECLGSRVDNSWTAQLTPDPEQERHAPNKAARQVFSGHYVLVRPTPLPEPYLVAYSPEVAALLDVDEAEFHTDRFARLFSGVVDEVTGFNSSWATPYALSIYGAPQFPTGAGPKSNGYGDGRAISIAEVLANSGRWELQLKGSGTTPFCRGSDGRAVLRSSVREFLASEAMHHLGVPTARALSLVASGTERVRRPWYSKGSAGERHGGDVLQEERCAMTTRVAPSFLRVGHFELFGRRAQEGDAVGRQQLKELAEHALFREYPHLIGPSKTLQEQLLAMVAEAAERFAKLAAEWVRVGYVQSNFNADNCLVSGLTIDYGPFGFVEKYDPEWGMWIHSGQHFAFMNQPTAAGRNFRMFAESLIPLLDKAGAQEVASVIRGYPALASEALDKVWAFKLGLQHVGERTTALWREMEKLMRKHPTDYTILWRQLTELVEVGDEDASSLETLLPAFYDPPPAGLQQEWRAWLRGWRARLRADGRDAAVVSAAMRQANPRYVPREELLVEAYEAAQRGDHSAVRALQELFRHPYEEQPSFGERYYRRRAAGAERQGGVGFMS